MIRIALLATLLLAACKHAQPEVPLPGDDSRATGRCDLLDEAGCRARTDCAVIEAQQETVEACVLAPAVVGCQAADTACADAITYATDADGNSWWFMDTCVPAGFTAGADPQGATEPPSGC